MKTINLILSTLLLSSLFFSCASDNNDQGGITPINLSGQSNVSLNDDEEKGILSLHINSNNDLGSCTPVETLQVKIYDSDNNLIQEGTVGRIASHTLYYNFKITKDLSVGDYNAIYSSNNLSSNLSFLFIVTDDDLQDQYQKTLYTDACNLNSSLDRFE
ncbi:hypothetical protein [Flammeovirga pacifica]|uniref:GOLD domain-containing protein n=1 Tax=Flammeovirga pacifica TaxID=915059 RepID=A0A1S1YW06_FLAPC|nr:hypothetical protein [Flammeovirga pacifica]OHX65217.1 hypothetical protein NH26_02035 [Flammeovirga pacifica]